MKRRNILLSMMILLLILPGCGNREVRTAPSRPIQEKQKSTIVKTEQKSDPFSAELEKEGLLIDDCNALIDMYLSVGEFGKAGYLIGKTGNAPLSYLDSDSSLLLAEYISVHGMDDKDISIFAKALPTRTSRETYAVGQTGPSGGIIIYDADADNSKGNSDGLISLFTGWRYIEASSGYLERQGDTCRINTVAMAAPQDMDAGSIPYGITTSPSIGSGKENSRQLSRKGFNIASICQNLTLISWQDWFLPSIEELKIFADVCSKDPVSTGYKTYGSDSRIWSSTVDSNGKVQVWNMTTNKVESISPESKALVRPFRIF